MAPHHPGASLRRCCSDPITLTCRDRVVSEESLYMELLAAEHNDEEPDAGAQEGFGDDYDG
ncbi:hypothetical protein B0H13DRAFT_1614820 [Mycena leptocephala]|nr:hypothetical protein B0H13DRAFT_1614820 [Mycena leptocephala]